MRLNPSQKQDQSQGVYAKQEMKQAFLILTLPQEQLATYLEQELQINPLFNWEESKGQNESLNQDPVQLDFTEDNFVYLNEWGDPFEDTWELLVSDHETSFEELMRHFKEYTHEPLLIEAGRQILGNLDRRGLLAAPLDIPLFNEAMEIIKKLNPKGLGSRTLQESFLAQLSKGSVAYDLVAKHWKELLSGKRRESLDLLKKSLICPLLTNDKQTISPTQLYDIEILENGDDFDVSVSEDALPKFNLNLKHFNDPSAYFKKRLAQVKWILKNLFMRREFLKKIGEAILKENHSFFRGEAKVSTLLSVDRVSKKLEVHPSTIYRVLKDKWISTPQGLFSLNYFFQAKVEVEEVIKELIRREDHPLTDEEITQVLAKEGIKLSRRAVAKYREKLQIPSSKNRS